MWRRPRESPLHLVDRCLAGLHPDSPGWWSEGSRIVQPMSRNGSRTVTGDAGLPMRSTTRGTGCEGVDAELPPLGVWAEGVVAQGSSHSARSRGRPVSADTAVGRGRAPDPGDWAGAAGGWSFLLLPCQGYGRRPSPSAEIRRPRLRSGWAGVGSAVLETSSRVVPSVRRFWRTPRSGCTRTRAERA